MRQTLAVLLRFVGAILVLLGLVSLSLDLELLPQAFSLHDIIPFMPGASHSYIRIVPNEHSRWGAVLMLGVGASMFAAGKLIRRH